VKGCKSLLELTPSNELRLGARPPRACSPHGFALHQEAREGGEEAGPGLPALSAMQRGHSLQAAPVPTKVALSSSPLNASHLAVQILDSHRCRTIYWRKSGLMAPLCAARCRLRSVACGGEAAAHPLPVQAVTPCNAEPVWALAAHGTAAPALRMAVSIGPAQLCPACKPWEVTVGLALWVAPTRQDRLKLPKS